MQRTLASFLLLIAICSRLQAQVLPKEDCSLNYRMVGFSYPGGQARTVYNLEVAKGRYYDTDSFAKHIIISVPGNQHRMVVELPEFGAEYTWRVTTSGRKARETTGALHHFRTATNSLVDTNSMRLHILKPATKYSDAYVFMDGSKVLYDMEGHPLWFLPAVEDKAPDKMWGFGDLKYTADSTITYVTTGHGGKIIVADLNGTPIWKGPNTGEVSQDTIEHYNHEFTQLSNGNYMAMGEEPAVWKLPGVADTAAAKMLNIKGKLVADSTNAFYQKLNFITLMEYDKKGNLLWSWRSSKYFREADIYGHTNAKGVFDVPDVHGNSFYFNEKDSVIYVGFRDISRIIKLKYPSGEVLAVYGSMYKHRSRHPYDNKLFFHQHSVHMSQDGNLYMYNNNNRYPGALPTILVVKETGNGKKLKKVWEYNSTLDGYDTTIKEVPEFSALGSVQELPDGSILASMCANKYNRVFIVNRDKEETWSAMLQRWNENKKKWISVVQYRANILVKRSDLDKLIWKAEEEIK